MSYEEHSLFLGLYFSAVQCGQFLPGEVMPYMNIRGRNWYGLIPDSLNLQRHIGWSLIYVKNNAYVTSHIHTNTRGESTSSSRNRRNRAMAWSQHNACSDSVRYGRGEAGTSSAANGNVFVTTSTGIMLAV